MAARDREAHAHQSCGRSVIELYNAVRPHSALRWRPPAPEVWLPTPQVWPAKTLAHYAPTNYH